MAQSHVGEVAVSKPRASFWSVSLVLPQWLKVALLLLSPLLLLGMGELSGKVSGQQFGLVPVDGESMARIVPDGSDVFVIPVAHPKRGWVVSAVGCLDSSDDLRDGVLTPMVKIYQGPELLVSTDSRDHSTDFEVRGVVVAVLPVQKLLFWRNDSPSLASPDAHETTDEERLVIHTERLATSLIVDSKEEEIQKTCDKQVYVLDSLLTSWQIDLGGDVVCQIRVRANWQFSVKLYLDRESVKEPSVVAPNPQKFVNLFLSLDGKEVSNLRISCESGDDEILPMKGEGILEVEIWTKRTSDGATTIAQL